MLSFISPTRLASLWESLRVSFWFLPAAMAIAAVLLSYLLVELDGWLGTDAIQDLGWLYAFGPEGARAVLSAIASSMITVAGLTFSITMLTLQLASSQFGPRLLRDFMRDRGNQFVLGAFIATFLYCLLVLRTVGGTDETRFTPHLSVFLGVIFAIASLAALIYFIHHVATSIRIETVLSDIASQARVGVDRFYPATIAEGPSDFDPRGETAQAMGTLTVALPSGESGYVQRIDDQTLMRLAREHDILLRIEAAPGAFVAEGMTLLLLPDSPELDDLARKALHDCVILGSDRTPYQDIDLSLRRIVEIAQRALSPGINDPTTAMYCIDRLQEVLARLAARQPPSIYRFDPAHRLRIVAPSPSFESLAFPAFFAVARYGLADADVADRLLAAIAAVALVASPAVASTLRGIGGEIGRAAIDALALPSDQARVKGRMDVLADIETRAPTVVA